MFPVLWTIDPLDWCSSDVSCIVKNVCARADENDIILMHDQYKTTVTAALKIVDHLTEKGFEFVTVDELMFDQPEADLPNDAQKRRPSASLISRL